MTDLIEAMLRGEKRALARLVTMVENNHSDTLRIMEAVFPHRKNIYIVGVTGLPGAGKSSIVDRLISFYRKRGLTVGVIAVDPSSPLSGGALLGDRIRMRDHDNDDGVFIRSMAARGFLGGLARNTLEVVTLFSAYGFDRLIIETVGVGQGEVDIMGMAHTCLVTVVPGFGDDIQTLKAGLFEIADIFVVNKTDEFDPSQLAASLRAVESFKGKCREVQRKSNIFLISARENINMDQLFEAVEERWNNIATRATLNRSLTKAFVDAHIQSALFAVLLEILGTGYREFRKRMEEDNTNIYKEIETIIKRNS